MKEIIYVTGNWAKIKSAKMILEPLGFKVSNVKMDTIEIQANTMEEVVNSIDAVANSIKELLK